MVTERLHSNVWSLFKLQKIMEDKEMAEEKTTATETTAAQTTAADPVVKTEQGTGTGDNTTKKEVPAGVYDQAYIDQLLADQKAAQEAAVAEALKVAGMDAESKKQYEKEQAAKELETRAAELARRELKADAREVLQEREVPMEFLDMLLGKDMKETKGNIDTFKNRFDAAVQAQVEKRMVGKTPQSGNSGELSEEAAMAAEIAKYM